MSAHIVTWEGEFHFVGQTPDGRRSQFDLPVEKGGGGAGPTPMEMVLHALAACSAFDVVSILQRMRLPLEGLRVEIDADRADDHPKVYTAIRLRYVAKGDLPENKVRRAVELSANKYCSVSAMLKSTATVEHEIVVEGASGS